MMLRFTCLATGQSPRTDSGGTFHGPFIAWQVNACINEKVWQVFQVDVDVSGLCYARTKCAIGQGIMGCTLYPKVPIDIRAHHLRQSTGLQTLYYGRWAQCRGFQIHSKPYSSQLGSHENRFRHMCSWREWPCRGCRLSTKEY